jgi:predicted RND superfamily exporter protein
MCSLMARGAIVSMILVVVMVPAMLVLFDRVIGVTSVGFRKKA